MVRSLTQDLLAKIQMICLCPVVYNGLHVIVTSNRNLDEVYSSSCAFCKCSDSNAWY